MLEILCFLKDILMFLHKIIQSKIIILKLHLYFVIFKGLTCFEIYLTKY